MMTEEDEEVYVWEQEKKARGRPEISGKVWVRAKECYPTNGQRVLYWFEPIGGPFEGYYEEEVYEALMRDGPQGTVTSHIFGGKHGWLTNDDVWYIPLEDNEELPG